ncbi:MAG: hypothetical protein RJA07_1761 [Bacteroidota bacterium]
MDDFWQYFPKYDAWVIKTNISYKLSATTPFSINDTGYFIAGYSSLIQGGYLKTNFEYTLDTLGYTGITKISNQQVMGLSIYPNPTASVLHIKTDDFKIKSVSISNIIGEELFNLHIVTPTTLQIIDVSGFSAGVYFIKVTDENGNMMNGKFVK